MDADVRASVVSTDDACSHDPMVLREPGCGLVQVHAPHSPTGLAVNAHAQNRSRMGAPGF